MNKIIHINKLTIDSTRSVTDMCQLGVKHKTDKSPLVSHLAKILEPPLAYGHAYTAVYDLLFSSIRYKDIKIGEIGIKENASIRCFRDYFPKAEIHGFEYDEGLITAAEAEKLPNVYYHWIDAHRKETITNAMEKSGGEFDILIDDSSHTQLAQLNCIETLHNYLKPGGVLVIEDICPEVKEGNFDYIEEKFTRLIQPVKHHYSNMLFVDTKHIFQYSGTYQNDKLLILFKR